MLVANGDLVQRRPFTFADLHVTVVQMHTTSHCFSRCPMIMMMMMMMALVMVMMVMAMVG